MYRMRILTRLGKNTSGSLCGGHNSAVGLRLYFDSSTRPAKLGTSANPINYIDPSGYITENESKDALDITSRLEKYYNVRIVTDWGYYTNNILISLLPPSDRKNFFYGCDWRQGWWSLDELHKVEYGVDLLATAMGGSSRFMQELGGVNVVQKDMSNPGTGGAHIVNLDGTEPSKGNTNKTFGEWTVVHELAHAWDGNHGWQLSEMLMRETGGYISKWESTWKMLTGQCDVVWNSNTNAFGPGNKPLTHGRKPGCNKSAYFYGDMPAGADWNFSPKEDFAESVVMYVGLNDRILNAQKKIDRYKITGVPADIAERMIGLHTHNISTHKAVITQRRNAGHLSMV